MPARTVPPAIPTRDMPHGVTLDIRPERANIAPVGAPTPVP
jgi:hypothetical protein